jgi:23S rRNA pseudouridine1911/1915/1917 synthase
MTQKNVPDELARTPIDAVVRTLYAVSWGEARKWIERGKITVDGEAWTDPRRKVHAGASVTLTMHAPKPRPATDLPEKAIVYVDAHVVVVNKPSGISTVPYDDSETGTLDERVRAALQKADRRADKGSRPPLGVVHRIDKETSGLVVFTRSWLAKQSLSSQFRDHSVHRRYYALAHGDVKARTIRSFITANRGDGLRGTRPRGDEGQLAITHVEVVEQLPGATLIACRLETGRTHQIRVHLSESGHPIIGERVYVRGWGGTQIPAPRLMLHARELGFTHPATEEEVRWEMEPPKDFAEVLARLRAR